MEIDDKIEILLRDYGFDRILKMNDLTKATVLLELIAWGLIDVDDYFYNEIDDESQDNED